MNIPFVSSIWNSAEESDPETLITKYLQMVSYQKKKYYNFTDGEFGSSKEKEKDTKEISNDMMAKWGDQEDSVTYKVLESIYNSYIEIKPPNGKFEQDRYVQCAYIKYRLDKTLMTGETKEISGLRRAYQSELESLGLNIIKGEEEEKTLGERIRLYEENDPIPEPTEDLRDVDKVSHYIQKNFLFPVKRMFGQATEEEIQTIYE